MTNTNLETSDLKDLSQELFDLLGIEAKLNLTEEDGKEGSTTIINIDAPDAVGLLIGYHGETLNAIQSFLTIAYKQRTGEWRRILVDVADYRSKQEENLISLAKQAAERAKHTGEAQNLYNLNSQQRRVVHLALSEDKEIETLSEGEGEERYLIIRQKS